MPLPQYWVVPLLAPTQMQDLWLHLVVLSIQTALPISGQAQKDLLCTESEADRMSASAFPTPLLGLAFSQSLFLLEKSSTKQCTEVLST